MRQIEDQEIVRETIYSMSELADLVSHNLLGIPLLSTNLSSCWPSGGRLRGPLRALPSGKIPGWPAEHPLTGRPLSCSPLIRSSRVSHLVLMIFLTNCLGADGRVFGASGMALDIVAWFAVVGRRR